MLVSGMQPVVVQLLLFHNYMEITKDFQRMPVVFAKEYPAYFARAQVTVDGGRGRGAPELVRYWRGGAEPPRTATQDRS